MTTANETETDVEVNVSQEPISKCEVKWWATKGGKKVIDFECGAPATHLVRAHSGANLPGVEHTMREEPMCERCLNEAMLLYCSMHGVYVVASWSLL